MGKAITSMKHDAKLSSSSSSSSSTVKLAIPIKSEAMKTTIKKKSVNFSKFRVVEIAGGSKGTEASSSSCSKGIDNATMKMISPRPHLPTTTTTAAAGDDESCVIEAKSR